VSLFDTVAYDFKQQHLRAPFKRQSDIKRCRNGGYKPDTIELLPVIDGYGTPKKSPKKLERCSSSPVKLNSD